MTRKQVREHRALVDLTASYNLNSTQKGNNNKEIIRRPDYLVTALRKAGLLDEFVNYTPMTVGRFKRTGVTTSIDFVYEYQEQILEAIEDHTSYNPYDGWKVLRQGAILAEIKGYVLAESPVITALSEMFKELSTTQQHKLFSTN